MPSEDLTPTQQIELHSIATGGTPLRPGGSYVTIAEPCAKHAKNPPGAQSWKDELDALGNPVPKRDPNGFDHDCADCVANFKIVKE